MKRMYVLSAFLFFLVGASDGWALKYFKPHRNQESIDAKMLQIPPAIRNASAQTLAKWAIHLAIRPARGGKDPSELVSRAIALALALDPECENALVADFQMAQGLLPEDKPDAKKDQEDEANKGTMISRPQTSPAQMPPTRFDVKALKEALQLPMFKRSTRDVDVLAYHFLLEMAAEMDPMERILVLEWVKKMRSGYKNDWSLLVSADSVGVTAAADAVASGKKIPTDAVAGDTWTGSSRATIKALLVTETQGGDMVGFTNDLIATTPNASTKGLKAVFATDVGEHMQIALEEAERFVNSRATSKYSLYPSVTLSFQDKYTPKDGGSAGTACAMLLLSILEGGPLNSKVAVTGDITANGKVLKVGGVPNKIDGALAGGADCIIVPADNEDSVGDFIVLNGISALWRAQIFGVETVDQALAVAAEKRAGGVAEVWKLFEEVIEGAKSGLPNKGIRSPASVAKIEKICEILPWHLSAKFLLKDAKGHGPTKLTQQTSVEAIMLASRHFIDSLYNEKVGRDARAKDVWVKVLEDEKYDGAMTRLNAMKSKIHPQTNSLLSAMNYYIMQWRMYSRIQNQHQKQSLLDARAKVMEEMGKLSFDRKFLESILR